MNVTFMDQYGNTVELTPDNDPGSTILQPYSRNTIHVNNHMPDKDVSTTVTSANGESVIVERAMYWSRSGIEWIGGHDCMGVTSAGTTWYLAEGCTRGFDSWILIQNPSDNEAQIKVTFMDQDGNTVEVTTETDPENTILEAYSRSTILINDYLPDKDVSTTVESINEVPIIVERAMYWDSGGISWVGGHDSVGVVSGN